MQENPDRNQLKILDKSILAGFTDEELNKVDHFLRTEIGISLSSYNGKNYQEAYVAFTSQLNRLDEGILSPNERCLIVLLWHASFANK